MSGLRRLRVTELHPNLICILCGGYYVDATTIVECLHSFCKTCIVRYLESSKFCPICDVQVHKTKPLLSIRPDKTLQDIVYKLVPGLYQNEMCRRKEFYTNHPEADPPTPEDGGRDLGRWYILPDDPVSVALHPAPSSYSPKCVNLRSMPAPNYGCPSGKTHLEENKAPPQDLKDKYSAHVRYLQCPAGVSVAQLKRLLRAKFAVGPSHPIAVLTCTSSDPLSDTLTLVDVAYITSWQRTEPLQLQYRIYERASKKIKLDPDTFSSEAYNPNEEMPKLEPSVGKDVNISAYAALDSTGNVLEYRCAPLLQAFETSECDASSIKGEKWFHEKVCSEAGASGKFPSSECKDCAADDSLLAAKSERIPDASVEEKEKEVLVVGESGTSGTELTQGSHSDIGNVMKTDVGEGASCDNNSAKVENVTSGNNVVDTFVTYTRAYTAPSNGVNVGVTFIPSEMGYISSAGVPCAIIPSGGCVPVSGDCIPGSVSVPTVCSGAALHRPLQGGGGPTDNVNLWVAAAGLQTLVSETALLPAESESSSGDVKDGEEEGKEVQLTISESGIMSASGRGTTVEGMVNAIESEACELLSKIESGSLGDDFPPKSGEKPLQKPLHEPNAINKKPKAKDNSSTDIKNKVDGKATGNGSKSQGGFDGKGNGGNKNQVALKGEKIRNVISGTNVSAVNHKPSNVDSKDVKEMPLCDKTEVDHIPDAVSKSKSFSESCNKNVDKKQSEPRKTSEVQHIKDSKDGNNHKDSRCSHIPASLTAASMANMNKHLKAGTSKASHVEDINKSKDSKSNNSGVHLKKEGKQEHGGKQSPSGSCRKSSQPYGYKTLKTPPKSWNPTISREHLALAAGKASNAKDMHERVRTNKFFKVRNAPRFLGNPSAGVKPMYSGTNDSNASLQKPAVLKIDPKTLGPVTVPVSNDARSSLCLTALVSSSTSSVSSGQLTCSPASQTTMSVVGSLPTSTIGQTSVCSLQTGITETATTAVVSSVEDTVVTSTKAASTLPTALKSVAKESTNSSSKVIGNKYTANVQESKVTHENNKSTSSSCTGSKLNKNSATHKNDNVSNVQTSVSNSKVEAGGQLSIVPETKANGGTVGQLGNTMGNFMVNSNSSKLSLSTATPACITQLKAATVNTLTASSTGFQTQQHFTVGSTAVGIIPSCGVSLPATIGTMPLPYYTNPSLGYPTYPYLYQSPDAAIGLIPSHPSASFIPTFPTCLPPRSPLGPRNIGGAKILPELSLQSSLLPMVPLVSQVPPQALSPGPMTPPSPRTPTSNQSAKPYPTQSPRQSSTNHPRPLTPHSPKSLTTGHTTSCPAQSPKVQVGQSGKSQFGNQPNLPGGTQPLTQTLGTQIPNAFSSSSSSSSSQSSNSTSKLNACVQTSLSHTLIMPKSNLSFITSSKPSVPHPTTKISANQSVSSLSQQMASISSCYSNSPQSPKPSRPKTPQSPKTTSSVGCAVSSEFLSRSGSTTTQAVRHHTPHLSKCPTTDTRTTNVGVPRMAIASQDTPQLSVSHSPILSLPLSINQLATVIPTGGLTVPQISAFETALMQHPQAVQVSLPQTMNTVSLSADASGNSGSVALNKGIVIPTVSQIVSSSYLTTSPLTTHIPQSCVQNTSLLTTGSLLSSTATTSTPACISAVPSCTSLPQNFPYSSNASSANSFSALSTPPVTSTGPAPCSNEAELPKVTCIMPVASKESTTSSVAWNNSASSCVSVNATASTSCAITTEASRDTVPRNGSTVVSVNSAIVSIPSSTSCNLSLPASSIVCSVPANVLSSVTARNTAIVTTPTNALAVSAVPAIHSKVDILPTRTSAAAVGGGGDVHTSSIANTFSSSTSVSGMLSVPFNGTSDITSPQPEASVPPVSTATTAQSQSSSEVLNPSGGRSGGEKSVVVSVKEKGGSLPQSSACTPVCDVTHVIDAKLPRAEPSGSSSNSNSSDGPRPCLKS